MIKRIAAITFIFLCTAFAWGILGATIFPTHLRFGQRVRQPRRLDVGLTAEPITTGGFI